MNLLRRGRPIILIGFGVGIANVLIAAKKMVQLAPIAELTGTVLYGSVWLIRCYARKYS